MFIECFPNKQQINHVVNNKMIKKTQLHVVNKTTTKNNTLYNTNSNNSCNNNNTLHILIHAFVFSFTAITSLLYKMNIINESQVKMEKDKKNRNNKVKTIIVVIIVG